MTLTYDTLVVGGGMAGMVSALKAASQGKSVGVVRSGWGATALSSGAIDLASDPLRIPGRVLEEERDWRENVREIVRRDPHHPYSVLSQGGIDAEIHLQNALEFLAQELDEVGLKVRVGGHKNLLLVHPFGIARYTGSAQEIQAGGDLASRIGRKVLIVGFKNLLDFPAEYLARSLQEELEPQGWGPFAYREIEVPRFAGGSVFEAALTLDDYCLSLEPVFRNLAEEGFLVIFPPVLGVNDYQKIEEIIKNSGLVNFGEALAGSPSVPGVRLKNALEKIARRRGISLVAGRAIHAEVRRRQVKSVKLQIGTEEEIWEGETVILATGKYVGGGIEKRGRFREPLFDLPVYIGNYRLEDQFIKDFLYPDPLGFHPLFRAGIRVNSKLQPLDKKGDIRAENLFAAGAVLSESDSVPAGSGLGVAILTGYQAGINASGGR